MATAPYDNLIIVINAVNTRLNGDVNTLLPIGGQLLKFSNAYSQQLVNTAYRKLQQFLVSEGYEKLTVTNTIIPNVPPVANEDASIQTTLSWSGYNDGVTPYPAVVLPQNLIRPTKMAERPTQDAPNVNQFWDMDGPEPYIPALPKIQRNVIWTWDNDQINMPGSTVAMDLRVDFMSYLADFADTGDVITAQAVRWFNQPIPIMRAVEPLASYVMAEVERARENLDAVAAYTNDGQAAAVRDILGRRPIQ